MNRITPASTVERYFTLHFAPNVARRAAAKLPSESEDVCIARHHNGLCLVCLSPIHPIVASHKEIASVDYRVEMKQVVGKRKKGGIAVEERTRLCTITCSSGEQYAVQCAVKGTLIEYNEALGINPSLISSKPLTAGYLAAVLPWASKMKTAVDHLIPADKYEGVLPSKDSEE